MDSGLTYSRLPAAPAAPVPPAPQPPHAEQLPARRLPPRANPQAVLVAIALGAVATVGLWFYDTPSVTGLQGWLNGAGRILGLLAGYSIVVLVALMARIPALEHGLGADRLARWHAMGGRYTVSLVVSHALLITWGYAVSAHTNVVHQEWTLLRSYPDVLAATVAGLLLVGVGISSARAARRRLRYETWYYLHFYTYLAMALAFSHQFAVGEDFMFNRAARVVWATFYLVVGAALVWYRIVVPLRQAMRHRMRVAAVTIESPDAVSLVVRGQHLDELAAQPGHSSAGDS